MLVGTSYVPMHTNGDGGCSVHAAWGDARVTNDGTWELWCDEARSRIRTLLGHDVRTLRSKVDEESFFQYVDPEHSVGRVVCASGTKTWQPRRPSLCGKLAAPKQDIVRSSETLLKEPRT